MKDFKDEIMDFGNEIKQMYAEVPISFQSYDRVVSEELTNNSPFKNIMMSLLKTNLELSEKFNKMVAGKDFNPILFDRYEYILSKDVEHICKESLSSLIQKSVINYVFDTLNYLNNISNRKYKYNLFDILLSNTKDPRFTDLYRIPDTVYIVQNMLSFKHSDDDGNGLIIIKINSIHHKL